MQISSKFLMSAKVFQQKIQCHPVCSIVFFVLIVFPSSRGVLWFDRDGATDVQVGLREGNLNAVLVQDSINVFLDEGNVSHL